MSIQGGLGERRGLEKFLQDMRVEQSFEIQSDFTEGPRGRIHVTIQMLGEAECILESASMGRWAWEPLQSGNEVARDHNDISVA